MVPMLFIYDVCDGLGRLSRQKINGKELHNVTTDYILSVGKL